MARHTIAQQISMIMIVLMLRPHMAVAQQLQQTADTVRGEGIGSRSIEESGNGRGPAEVPC